MSAGQRRSPTDGRSATAKSTASAMRSRPEFRRLLRDNLLGGRTGCALILRGFAEAASAQEPTSIVVRAARRLARAGEGLLPS